MTIPTPPPTPPQNKHNDAPNLPDVFVNARDVFGVNADINVPAFSSPPLPEHIPDIDPDYVFDPDTVLALITSFKDNRRVLIQGAHGTGKSSHIEQVAARLNWPCMRVNLDSHISRMDLVGRDAITLQNGKQVTSFQEGVLPWAVQRPCALVFDEYDAGRPDVMFVIQRVLETQGKFTLLDQNRVINPHPAFRLLATANTVGLGDPTGLYHGAQHINQAQMDRWNVVTALNYLPHDVEAKIILSKAPQYNNPEGKLLVDSMIKTAQLTRSAFLNGDVSTVMSPRTLIVWAENTRILNDDLRLAFRFSFLNKCDDDEKPVVSEFFQRAFGMELSPQPPKNGHADENIPN